MYELEFLSDDERLRSLCRRYWATDAEGKFPEKVSAIAVELGASEYKLAEILSQHCVARRTDMACRVCGKGRPVRNRSEALCMYEGTCDDCKAVQKAEADRARATAEQEARAKIERLYDPSRWAAPDEATLRQALFFVALVRLGASEDMSYVKPIRTLSGLSPGGELAHRIGLALWKARLLVPHPGSPLDAFVLNGDERQCYTTEVFWLVPGGRSMGDVLDAMEDRLRDATLCEGFEQEAAELWAEIAIEEALEFLLWSLDRYRLPFTVGDKTRRTINTALETFSLGEVFYFIYLAAKDCAAYYQQGNVPKHQAANSIVNRIQSRIDRYTAGNWPAKPFRRNYDCPQSEVSRLLSVVWGVEDVTLNRRLRDLLRPAPPPEEKIALPPGPEK